MARRNEQDKRNVTPCFCPSQPSHAHSPALVFLRHFQSGKIPTIIVGDFLRPVALISILLLASSDFMTVGHKAFSFSEGQVRGVPSLLLGLALELREHRRQWLLRLSQSSSPDPLIILPLCLDSGRFHLAASKGLTECLTILLANGADINSKNEDGELHWALGYTACLSLYNSNGGQCWALL